MDHFQKADNTSSGRRMKAVAAQRSPDEEAEASDENEEEAGGGDQEKKQKRLGGGRRVSSGGGVSCQVERCTADLTEAKRYHRRHKVCEFHAKATSVLVSGLRQRFCQQCSRFHELQEFDDAKRSCRRRLAGHNERRRKTLSEPQQGEAGSSSSRPKGPNNPQCRPADHERATRVTQMSYSAAANPAPYKHFQIR